MTAARIVPADGYPFPPEPDLTPEEVAARSERIVPNPVERRFLRAGPPRIHAGLDVAS